jgi:hypothetical protein
MSGLDVCMPLTRSAVREEDSGQEHGQVTVLMNRRLHRAARCPADSALRHSRVLETRDMLLSQVLLLVPTERGLWAAAFLIGHFSLGIRHWGGTWQAQNGSGDGWFWQWIGDFPDSRDKPPQPLRQLFRRHPSLNGKMLNA